MINGSSIRLRVYRTTVSAAAAAAAIVASNAGFASIARADLVLDPDGASTSLVLGADPDTITATWTDGTTPNGSTLTSYEIVYTDQTSPGQVTDTQPSGTHTDTAIGLTPGDTYGVRVDTRFTPLSTTTGANEPTITVPFPAPDAPTGVTATGDYQSAEVSWTAGSGNGTPVTGSTISYTDTDNSAHNGTFPVSGDGQSATVTGLVGGDHYTFRVVETTLGGNSSASGNSNSVLVTTTPGAPREVTATAGTTLQTNNRVTVSWTAPSYDGDSAITGYTIDYVDNDDSDFNGSDTVGPNARSDVITGLQAGDTYHFTVTATNANGAGIPSSSAGPAVPVDLPGVPTNITAVAGNSGSEGTVFWTIPNAHGSAITGYTLYATDTSDQSGLSDRTGNAGSSAAVGYVENLVPGDVYSFRVVATNGLGSSVRSHASNTIIPFTFADAPDTPTVTGATGDLGNPTVSWTAPDDGFSSISEYHISWTDSLHPGDSGGEDTNSTDTSETITSLIPGETYTFTVAAINEAGTGNNSGSSDSFEVRTVAGAPTGVSATAGQAAGAAHVVWTAPVSDGFASLTGYTITLQHGSDTPITQSAGSGDTSADVTGLTPGEVYTVSLTADNAIGSSIAADGGTVLPYDTPSAPFNLTGSYGNSSVTLSWAAPGNGGSAITGYTIHYTDSSDSSSGSYSPIGTGTSATVPGLVNGDSYTFTVVAINAGGPGSESAATDAIVPATIPDQPQSLHADPGSNAANLSWNEPFDGGHAITGYTIVAVDTSDQSVPDVTSHTDGDGTTATVTGLIRGDSYYFTVMPTNDVGDGPVAQASNTVVPYTTPSAPVNVTAAETDSGDPSVSWSTPEDNGDRPIIGYTISYTDISNSDGSGVFNPDLNLAVRSQCLLVHAHVAGPNGCVQRNTVTVPNLQGGDFYTFTVAAINLGGTGAYSDPTDPVVEAFTAPEAPEEVAVVAGSSDAVATWTAPFDGGSGINTYDVTYRDLTDNSHTVVDSVNGQLTTDTADLVPGDHYVVSVTAINSYGSTSSSETDPVMPYTFADAPTGVAAVAAPGKATVRWTTPAADGFSPITGYKVVVDDQTTTTTRSVPYGTALSQTVTGLTNGHRYSFTVVAMNAAGASVQSRPSATVTPQLPLALQSVRISSTVAVGLDPSYVPFSVTLNRPGAVTVNLVRGSTVVSHTTVPAATTTVSGRFGVRFGHSSQTGVYSWVIRDAGTNRVIGTSPVTFKQRSTLAMAASRSGSTITIKGSAKFANLDARAVTALAGQSINVQRWTANGWLTVKTVKTDSRGHILLTLHIGSRVGLRLVDAGTSRVLGASSTPDVV